MRRARSLAVAAVAAVVSAAGCAPAGQAGRTPAPRAPGPEVRAQPWTVGTREHVDLWLHGFAMLQEDTTRVPFFRPGYRDEMRALRTRLGVTTSLDANLERLRARFPANPNLVSAQFIPLYFGSWEDVKVAANIFFGAEGNAQRVSEPAARRIVAMFANYFPYDADRDWLRTFIQSLDEESNRFYHGHWLEQQRERAATLTAVDALWQNTYRAKLQRFLNNAKLESGDFFLSLPLDGEGRTVTESRRENTITVGFPARPADAVEAIYVFAHEAVSGIVSVAVDDNTTPNEKREGAVDRYSATGTVRAGAMLLAKVAPELLDGYARYYLRVAKAPATGDAQAALAAAFPLPNALRDSIARQLEVVLAGI